MSQVFYATGRRKTSTARVFVKPGTGAMSVNGKNLDAYLPRLSSQSLAKQPLEVTEYESKLDVQITVKGGGEASQAGAIRMGLARAISLYDTNQRSVLKAGGFLTRDSRMVERKKYGKHGARRSCQFSKR